MPSSRQDIHENLVHARSRLLAGELAEARAIARRMLGGANDVSVRAFLESTDRRAIAEWSKARAAGEPEAMLAAAEMLLAFGLFEDRWLQSLVQAAIKGEPTPEIVHALRQRSLETPLPREETFELIQLVESAAGRRAALSYALDAVPKANMPVPIVERAIELALALAEETALAADAANADGAAADDVEHAVSAEAAASAARTRLDALADAAAARLSAATDAAGEGADTAEIYAAERARAAAEARAVDDLDAVLRRTALEIAILRATPLPELTFESRLGAFAVMVPERRGQDIEESEAPAAAAALPDLPTLPIPRGNRRFVRQFTKLGSLFALNMKAEIANEPLGWIWWVLEPILQIVMITLAVILLGLPLVNGMQIMPFAIIGVVIWLSTRQAIMVSLVHGGPLISQLDFPQVRAAHIQLARALRPLAIYLFVGVCVVAVAFELDRSPFPDDPLQLLAAIFSAWLIGLGVGSILGSIALRWTSLRRLVGPIMRVTGLTSGLFFLPEQLPPNLAEALLWNPLMHAILIGRSAFFVQYDSPDASWTYLIVWLFSALLIGLVCFMNDERKRSRLR